MDDVFRPDALECGAYDHRCAFARAKILAAAIRCLNTVGYARAAVVRVAA